MAQNIQQWSATGTFDSGPSADITALVTWSLNDTSIATVNSSGIVTLQPAGLIYGADIMITATLSPATPGTGTIVVIPSDSGSRAPLMPQRDSHWVALGLSPWGAYGGCQESTGSLVLSGSAGYTLTPVNVAASIQTLYSQPVPGWTRVGISPGSGSNGARISAAAGVGPNPATTSMALLCYALVGPSAGSTQIFGLGATAGSGRLLMVADSNTNSSGQVDLSFNGILKRMTGPLTTQHSDRVHPYLLVYNRTSGEVWGFTDQCIVFSGSAPAQTDGTKMFGANNNPAASGTMLYWASCTGALAESFAGVNEGGAFLSNLGWNVSYLNCPSDSGTIRCPITPACWKGLGLLPWAASFNLQEVTGAVSSFDSWKGTNLNGWNMTPSLNMTYRNDQPGWLRRAVNFPDIASARLAVTNNLIGSYTGSVAFLGYCRIAAGAGTGRSLFGGWNAALGGQFRVQYSGLDGLPQVNCSGVVSTGINDHRDSRVHPFLAVYDVTNLRVKLYTDLEAITGSYGILNQTPAIGLGAIIAGQTCASASHTFFSVCTGSTAELLSDNGRASQFLKTLGWPLVW